LQSHSPKSADATSTNSNQNEHKKQPPPAYNDLDGLYEQDPTAPLRSSSPTKRNTNAIFHHETDTESISSSSSSAAQSKLWQDVALPEARVGSAYVAETNLPTDVGHFRLRAYRITSPTPQNAQFTGTEPCVIYCTDKPPFGNAKNSNTKNTMVPVRIHDQCFTSEVFRSRRYVLIIMISYYPNNL
jgi:hypothetical protein